MTFENNRDFTLETLQTLSTDGKFDIQTQNSEEQIDTNKKILMPQKIDQEPQAEQSQQLSQSN